MSAKCGGVSSEKEPDDTVVEIVESIRPELETKLGQSFSEYKPISFKSQLVNGVNYFIKIHIGNDQYVHVRTHRSFAGEKTLRAVQRGKQLLDTIEYFDVEQE